MLRTVTLQTRAPKVEGRPPRSARALDRRGRRARRRLVDGVDTGRRGAVGELDRRAVIAAALDELQAGRAQWSYSQLTRRSPGTPTGR